MLTSSLLLPLSLAAASLAQQVGNYTAESHPRLPWQECTRSGCTTKSSASVTLDANWRWVHVTGNYTNCYTGSSWNTSICTSGTQCASNCALEGANYQQTYGISTSGNALTLKFVTKGENTNIGSRTYLMESDDKYQMFNVLNKEFTFDVDVSQLPCGLNGALYFVQMDQDGGASKYSGNKAGAKYGTGYCDSQCPRDIKYINGEVNRALFEPIALFADDLPRLMSKDGTLLPTTPMLAPASTVPAAERWISGRRTQFPLPTPLTLARPPTMAASSAAQGRSATRPIVTEVCATPTVVTSTRTARATALTTERASPSTPARSSLSLPSSSPITTPPPAPSSRFDVSTFKMARSSPTQRSTSLALFHPSTLLRSSTATTRRKLSAIIPVSRTRVASHTWGVVSQRATFWCFQSGMITLPKCCGSTARTQSTLTPPSPVLPVAPARPIPASLRLWRLNLPTPKLSSLTSSSVKLARPTQALLSPSLKPPFLLATARLPEDPLPPRRQLRDRPQPFLRPPAMLLKRLKLSMASAVVSDTAVLPILAAWGMSHLDLTTGIERLVLGEGDKATEIAASPPKKNTVLVSHGRPPWYGEDGQRICDAFVIGVAGGSASGKTHVARQIVKKLGSIPTVIILSQDSFYKYHTPEELALAHANLLDFDHPDALDMPMFAACLADLKACKQSNIPIYSFSEHQRLKETKYLYGATIIIAEGIMALVDPALRALYDLKVFVQADSDLMLARRIKRDVTERGRTVDGVLDQYLRFVKPSYDNFVRPTAALADIIVPGSNNDVAIDLICTHIRQQLQERTNRFRHKIAIPHLYGPSKSPTIPPPCETKLEDLDLVSLPRTPQVQGILTILRDRKTDRQDFYFFADRLATLLAEHALQFLPFIPKTVTTPVGVEYHGQEPDVKYLCGVTILRSGGALERGFRRVINSAPVGCLLIQTEHKTGDPLLLQAKLPEYIRQRHTAEHTWVYLLDGQIGTAAAAFMAIRVLLDHGVKEDHIIFAAFLIARTGGISILRKAFPKVKIVCAAIDDQISEGWIEGEMRDGESRRTKVWLIQPGMGQIGDRYYL